MVNSLTSPLVSRLARYVELTRAEREMLDWIEGRERRLARGEVAVREGEACDNLFIVRSGWLHSSALGHEGQRQIFAFHFPGDVISLQSIAWDQPAHAITAVEDCVLAIFPKPLLGQVFRREARLAGLFHALAAVDYVAMCDRLLSVGRSDAFARVCVLMLQLWSRLKMADPSVRDRFHLPLTQSDIADAVGITKVHVNRVLAEMESKGLIERDRRTVRLVDAEAMIEATGFIDRYAIVATDWLDPGEAPAATASRAYSET